MSRTCRGLATLACLLVNSVVFAQVDENVATDAWVKSAQNGVTEYRLPGTVVNTQARTLPRPEVILTREMGAKQLGELTQDLQTLNHLVKKAIGQSSPRRSALGVSVRTAKEGSIRYTQGAGVVLTFNVNAVLWVANEKQAKSKPVEPKKPESEWDQTSRQLHNPPSNVRLPTMLLPGDVGVNTVYGVTSIGFNAASIRDLEERVSKALKNVVRVRHLKNGPRSEPIVIVLKGLGGTSMMTFTTDASKWDGDDADAVSVYRYGSTTQSWQHVYGRYLLNTNQRNTGTSVKGPTKAPTGGR